MLLIKPKFEILEQSPGIQGIYEAVERAGRICYKSKPKYRYYSEDKTRWINEDAQEVKEGLIDLKDFPIRGENISAKAFTDRMIASKHWGMLEHGTVYINPVEYPERYEQDPYSVVNYENWRSNSYITTNLRVLIEHGWLDDLQYLCDPTEHHEKRVTVKFICDRITGESFLRHRTILEDQDKLEKSLHIDDTAFSYARESTRYCKKAKGITFIIPDWLDIPEGDVKLNHGICWKVGITEDCENGESVIPLNFPNWKDIRYFLSTCHYSEEAYLVGLDKGFKPEKARFALNFAIASPLVCTATIEDWKKFFVLRCHHTAHPQARELAIPLREEFIKLGYIKD